MPRLFSKIGGVQAGLDALEAEVLKKKPRRSGLEVEEDIELLLFRLGHVGQMSVTTEIET